MEKIDLNRLREKLRLRPAGPVDNLEFEGLLASCWQELEGNQDGGMKSYKLIKRTRSLRWDPPMLTFGIERHGPTKRGSVYAHEQFWAVNVERGTAEITGSRKVQVAESLQFCMFNRWPKQLVER
jgi:hypothetical protein